MELSLIILTFKKLFLNYVSRYSRGLVSVSENTSQSVQIQTIGCFVNRWNNQYIYGHKLLKPERGIIAIFQRTSK